MTAYEIIQESHSLLPGDIFQSPSRLYFGVIEANGNIDIYRGDSPGDPQKAKVWSTNSSGRLASDHSVLHLKIRKGPFDNHTKNVQLFAGSNVSTSGLTQLWASGGSGDLASPMEASLGDDGKFLVRQNNRDVWSNGYSVPLANIEVTKIAFDLKNAKQRMLRSFFAEIPPSHNGTPTDQTFTLKGRYDDTRTISFSNTFGVKASFKTTITSGVPGVSSGSVEMGAETSFAYTWGETNSKTTSVPVELPIKILAGDTYGATLTVNVYESEVPYTMDGVLIFADGTRVARPMQGIYKGGNSLQGKVDFIDYTPGHEKKILFSADSPGALRAFHA